MKERIVIKVGTSTLLGSDEQPSSTFEKVAQSVDALCETYDVILVTSGAIGFGVRQLGLAARPTEVATLQALASLGQVGLMERWHQAMGDRLVGQVLLTAHDLSQPESVNALRATFHALWQQGIVPVVNENDTVTSDEITFGDNDTLAALVAGTCEASVLVFLTDQDGVQQDFGTNEQSRLARVTLSDARSHIRAGGTEHSRGGIDSKLLAASVALVRGCDVYIGHAATAGATESALAGQTGTKIIQ
ncbi:MAG: glutamate 5-kinase [Candidatus Saccharimonadales bacterium]